VSKNEAAVQHLCSSDRQFVIYSTFVLVSFSFASNSRFSALTVSYSQWCRKQCQWGDRPSPQPPPPGSYIYFEVCSRYLRCVQQGSRSHYLRYLTLHYGRYLRSTTSRT